VWHHAGDGQQQHIHLRVAHEPENVLPQHGVTTAGCAEEMGAEMAVHQHHGHAAGQHGHDDDQQNGRHQEAVCEQRHFHQRHAGSAHVQDGDDHVDAPRMDDTPSM
jgi:hypothetical protein